jgi:hypothetical protein
MVPFNLPPPNFKVRESEKGPEIWDFIRKQWVLVQPEEWVRQNFINWMLNVQHLPQEFISVEKAISPKSAKRYDILVFNKHHQPWMIVECKSADVKLDEKVLMQILSYHHELPVRYLVVTNGNECHVADIKKANQSWLASFPTFEDF